MSSSGTKRRVELLAAEQSGFVELEDGVEGGDVGGEAEGDFVELGDGVEGGDVGGGTQRGFGIESLERVRVSD